MLRKSLLVVLVALFCNQFSCAMVQKRVMPDKEKLEKYFKEHDLSYFASHTNIMYELAGHELGKDEIVKIVTKALGDYKIHLQTSMLPKDSQCQFSPLYYFFDEELEDVRKQLDLCIDKIWAEG
jgi:hypothetical protein